MQLKLIIILVFSLILVIFTMQNATPVSVKFFGWQSPSVSLIVVILVSVLFGGIFATILGLLKQWKLVGLLREKDKEIEKLSAQVSESKDAEVPKK